MIFIIRHSPPADISPSLFLSLHVMRRIPAFILLLVAAAALHAAVPDSVKTKQKVVAWQLNDEERILPASRDTLLNGFQVFDPAYLFYRYPIKTGNIASPATSACFPEIPALTDDLFIRYFEPYIFVPDRQVYYRARSPFTQGTYTSAGTKINQEQIMDIIHTQNINKYFNAGLLFNVLSGEGQYTFQRNKKKSFSLFSSYIRDRYAGFAHVSWNNIFEQENGGVMDPHDLVTDKPKDVPMKLGFQNNARSRVKNMNFELLNYYAFGRYASDKDTLGTAAEENDDIPHLPMGWGRLVYKLKYQRTGHGYNDDDPLSGFYRNIYFDSTTTYDTAYFRVWENEVALELQSNPEKKFSLGSRFGLVNEMEKYSANSRWDTLIQGHSGDTLITRMHENFNSNTAIFGKIFNDIGGKFRWNARARIYLFGYKAGNTEFYGDIREVFRKDKNPSYLHLYGHFKVTRPVFRLNHFSSNHFVWENDFKFIKDIMVGGAYRMPSIYAGIALEATFMNQYVYFDSLALPAQHDGSLVLYSLELNKDFHVWKITFMNNICLQQSSNTDVLPLPLFNFRNTTAFNQDIHFRKTGGLVRLQIGIDLYYQSRWYGYGYMPATGQFYVQHNTKIGNYPFMDAFINIKVQRLRFFFKVQDFNSSFMGPHYFTVVDHPMNQMFFKIGFSWTFYD